MASGGILGAGFTKLPLCLKEVTSDHFNCAGPSSPFPREPAQGVSLISPRGAFLAAAQGGAAGRQVCPRA